MKEEKKIDKKTSIGGQALIEGIMMRGPQKTAMAVRNPQGEIVLEKWDTNTKTIGKYNVRRIPFIRGVFNFIDSMRLGYKCLMRSAEIAGIEEETPKKENTVQENTEEVKPLEENAEASNDAEAKSKEKDQKNGDRAFLSVVMTISSLLGVALAIFLFVFLPTWVSTTILGKDATTEHPIWITVLSGVMKVVILIIYMLLVSLMKDIRRTFMYHGAEHKTIFCYEHGNELTVENVRKERRFHPRCGTSFLILMVLVSILVMIPISLLLRSVLPDAIIQKKPLYSLIRSGIAILLLPIMMGIGYELIKFSGRHDNFLTKIISAPGLLLQRMTVFEPEDAMIECAIKAFTEVLPSDDSDRW